METTTLETIKVAMTQKIKITKTGYEATVKANTPDEGVALVLAVQSRYEALKGQATVDTDKPRESYPVMVLEQGGQYVMKHGGGLATPWSPEMQQLSEDYRIKIDLVQNTKGLGWDITARGGSIDETYALIECTETALKRILAIAGESEAKAG